MGAWTLRVNKRGKKEDQKEYIEMPLMEIKKKKREQTKE